MISSRRLVTGLAVAAALALASTSSAGPIAFNFSSLNTSSTAAQISTLLTSQAGSTVTVSSGVQVNTNYAGDGHVVGPTNSGTVVPWTLGDSLGTVLAPTKPTSSNPSYSAYLATTSTFTMTFSVPVYSVEFDFEIFPDASPPVPQFEFSATDHNNHANAVYYNGVAQPNSMWVVNAIAPGTYNPYLPSDTYTASPASSNETNNQLLGVATIQFSASDPAYSITFADWPEEIGINNLILNPTGVGGFTSVTPAPPSAMLLGLGALGVAGLAARSRRRLVIAA
jgi:MYXO-CTERM domain-containing protein